MARLVNLFFVIGVCIMSKCKYYKDKWCYKFLSETGGKEYCFYHNLLGNNKEDECPDYKEG